MIQGEQVLVFDADILKNLRNISGFSMDDCHLRWTTDIIAATKFVDRQIAEQDESVKQIIPYTFISKGNQILTYNRSKQSGEGRLHNKWSIGFGGHINPEDMPIYKYKRLEEHGASASLLGRLILSFAIERELTEELDWLDRDELTMSTDTIGVIYDDSDAVGRVHFGYVMNIDLTNEVGFNGPIAKENTIDNIKWLTATEIIKLPNLENWSKLIIEKLLERKSHDTK